MKRRITLTMILMALLMLALAFAVCAAEPAYIDGEWIYAADGETKLTLHDTDGNPLIWYMKGEEIKYVRADQTNEELDVYVKYEISAGGSGFDKNVFSPEKTLKSIRIYDGGEEIIGSGSSAEALAAQSILLLNLEGLDIDALNGWLFGNKNGCCPLMRGIYLPSTLKGIGQEGFTNTKLVQIWNLENTQLFYINACDFANTRTLTQEATGGVFKNPLTLMRPLNVQYSQVKTYYMNPYMDYPNLNQLWHQLFRECSQLQEIYCPAQVNIGFGAEAFRSTPTQYVLFVTGTQADAENMIANTDGSHNGGFKAAVILSYDEYLADKETYDSATKQAYVVYGYDYCTAFFGGHAWKGEEKAVCESYLEEINICDSCSVCGAESVVSSIAPLFTDRGVSTKLFGGDFAIMQGYKIDKAAIAEYREYAADFDFGILVCINQGGTSIMPKPGDQGIVEISFDNMSNDYIEIKLLGIPSDCLDTPIVFSVYTVDGGKIYYLEGGKTLDSVKGLSYNDIAGKVQ